MNQNIQFLQNDQLINLNIFNYDSGNESDAEETKIITREKIRPILQNINSIHIMLSNNNNLNKKLSENNHIIKQIVENYFTNKDITELKKILSIDKSFDKEVQEYLVFVNDSKKRINYLMNELQGIGGSHTSKIYKDMKIINKTIFDNENEMIDCKLKYNVNLINKHKIMIKELSLVK